MDLVPWNCALGHNNFEDQVVTQEVAGELGGGEAEIFQPLLYIDRVRRLQRRPLGVGDSGQRPLYLGRTWFPSIGSQEVKRRQGA